MENGMKRQSEIKRRQFLKGSTLAAGAAVASAAAVSSFPKPALSQGKMEWRMVTSWPKGLPGVGTGAERLAERIGKLSDGRLTIKVYAAGELVPAASHVEFLGEHVGKASGGVLLGRAVLLSCPVTAAACLHLPGAVGGEIGILHAAFGMDQFLDEFQSLVRAQVCIQTGQTCVGDQNPGDSHELHSMIVGFAGTA